MSGKRGGKFSKPTRGGGKKFSRNLRPLEDEPEDRPGMWDEESGKNEKSDSDEEEGPAVTMTREERRAAEKARKEAAIARKAAAAAVSDDEEEEEDDSAPLSNANLTPTNPNAPGNANSGGMSRREREAKEAAAAKERWQKMHLAGKTDEAKADLARLALIRKEREEKAKQRQAELEEKKAASAAKMEASGRKK